MNRLYINLTGEIEMKDVLEFLKGKKTYIIAAAIGVLAAAKQLGFVDEETFTNLMTILTGGGLASFYAMFARNGKKIEE